MSQKHLKKVRILISIVFLVSILVSFVDFREIIPKSWFSIILFLQFVPSLIKFLNVLTIGAIGFVIILVLTVLFGRVYCSAFCPLGILQDFFIYLSRKFKIRKKHKSAKPFKYLRYAFLVVPVLFIFVGGIFIINLLDPYSNFGRISSDLFRPILIGLNNLLAALLEKVNIYVIFPVTYKGLHWNTLWFPAGILGLVLWFSFFHGRLYCNSICPVGTLLGLVSKISLFRIKIDGSTCTKCGKCLAVCKAGCIDFRNLTLDFDRCVGCYNCLGLCEKDSIAYRNSWKIKPIPVAVNTDNTKREFITKSLVYALGIFGISNKLRADDSLNSNQADRIPEKKTNPVSPPGSKSIQHFKNSCTACHLCVSACPTGVLQPSFLEYGITGMLQPHMDFHTNYCNYDCTKCGEVCPTGAILSLTKEKKKLTQTGKVKFEIRNCIVLTDLTACGSCSEHCPTQAVRMVPFAEGLTIPEIHPGTCVGCGACEYACPARPYRAIYVNGNVEHRQAKKPKFNELEVENQDEFPF